MTKKKSTIETETSASALRFINECKRLKLMGWVLESIDSWRSEVSCNMSKNKELTIMIEFKPKESEDNGTDDDEDLEKYLENLVAFVEEDLLKDPFPEEMYEKLSVS